MTDKKQEMQNPSTPQALTLDWDRYGAMLEASDLSEDQKRECIETVWSLVVSFVDFGFGIHPVQFPCGEGDETAPVDLIDVLSLISTSQQQQSDPADGASHGAGKRSPAWE
ncbi:hypothetical protein [Roseivivax sp. THAF30]|uniref:hypothetical protein n=1 Tax=Roseivivax sp. THAF30 TaxID=2587852 RepID=UPI001268C6C7|nr:hypothetical protein [Roseivivax sp. THAF30]QFT63788.1 hypothetical protein FIU91_12685 [Roseivivax sp. THAF30]